MILLIDCIRENIRVNGEFYVDSCIQEAIEMGLKVKVFEIDHYVGWGTPNDYETYKYWQSFFHKVDWHPYSLKNDFSVNKKEIENLNIEYRNFNQEWN